VIRKWSPVRVGQVANRKQLDYFVKLLNLNRDRYVSPADLKGSVPETLAYRYDVYETNPWHYFIQVDNSGTEERQWAPTFGLINTNLTGRDDRLTAI
jgi:hemolysin activation/secretion protein